LDSRLFFIYTKQNNTHKAKF